MKNTQKIFRSPNKKMTGELQKKDSAYTERKCEEIEQKEIEKAGK